MKRHEILALVAILGLLVALVAQHKEILQLRAQRPYLWTDHDVIDLAFKMFQEQTQASRKDLRNRFPVVMRFGAVRCVTLMLPRGYTARSPVYCFDKDSRPVQTMNFET